MKLGVSIAEGVEGWKTAVRAEQLGFSTAWFEDSQMVAADPIAMMALAAANTTRIKLGTGVLIPSNRIAPQTANSFATLNGLAPGRIILGVGTGFSGRRAMGHPPSFAQRRNEPTCLPLLCFRESSRFDGHHRGFGYETRGRSHPARR